MRQKSVLIIALIIITSLIIAGRLYYIQIVDKEYKKLALKNAVKKEYIIPERGYIYDRNNKLLVSNLPVYDVMAIPKQIKLLTHLPF